ncbi:type III-B CRISPR-associated protein Cas10/Cmr2 [Scytonema sp. UIC 10036]|uniref:type III-B CRISPR-associated protein Cas10/Cmr2 n=1 Tax=Scytonema sp. UIC 10036 TaxID=2304196 RepID=UPI0012DAACE9|nr:type III-B CRISPR-associated protein Cas10/Cmr2 [Scytonema sp. UIC 10036]MUG95455.1 type III-B CRISPR-associated protein Cas10/Cmr2 [Scytonema sp. UIC 10036]
MNVYHRKLYALVRSLETVDWLGTDTLYIYERLKCLAPYLQELQDWWESVGAQTTTSISSSSDRINLNSTAAYGQKNNIAVRHPISGQEQNINVSAFNTPIDISTIAGEEDVIKVFWWFWRYFPEQLARQDSENALLIPTHRILPDCPLHSYQSTVSALTGAIFHESNLTPAQSEEQEEGNSTDSIPFVEKPGETLNQLPYLLLFNFSPVQEFIKSSRKFLDFWAGSFLLHYFSALLCFEAAKVYGPDAVITPSLWNQEIIDAFIFRNETLKIQNFTQYHDPATHFKDNLQAQSLSTAGFPNVITVLVPNQKSVAELGKTLDELLKAKWLEMSQKVRACIKEKVRNLLDKENAIEEICHQISSEFPNFELENLKKELKQFRQQGCWEWNKLWDAQIENTWETYFVGIPLGHPKQPLEIDTTNLEENQRQQLITEWVKLQNQIARPIIDIPSQAELKAYHKINVGSLWGSLQARLGNTIQAIKNTRAWQIPVAPGERSTLSGQYSAVHPRFVYQQFQNGLGIPSESLRLFWRVMGLAYPGFFNGSEKLNAIELTKRMSWKHGGVAESLGVLNDSENNNEDNYENLIRFPNLCSIAAARFATDYPEKVEEYWDDLRREIYKELKLKHDIFCSRTRRPFQVKRADAALKERTNYGNGYNGVMFSSKWLADDMNLNPSETNTLRGAIDKVQKKHFGDASPADWWVLVLGDGDGMGGYVNGRKLKCYQKYLVEDLLDRSNINDEDLKELLEKTRKRMGPATHVGLNRALLDFSNRLVPYITEQRFCGRVIYSGGDDVMVALPLADLPGFLLSLRAAWCGAKDPQGEFIDKGGYWQWNTQNINQKPSAIPLRPLFTMGEDATMSLGIVIAHKSVPLPTVLEKLWDAEKEGAKKLVGGVVPNRENSGEGKKIPDKDGLCFRVIYGSGNTLEAFMKGHLLSGWWDFIQASQRYDNLDLSPVLYRLAEELPRHAEITSSDRLFQKVAKVVLSSRDVEIPQAVEDALLKWLDEWEEWAWCTRETTRPSKTLALGSQPQDIAMLLRFTAWLMANC